MLNPNDMKTLEDMWAEVRAMTERERNVLFSSLKERLPEKMLALMNSTLLDTVQLLLGQLSELNKGEFKTFVELYPTLWARLGVSEPEWAEFVREMADEGIAMGLTSEQFHKLKL